MIFNKIIYFDWSGTLAYPRTRHELLKGNKNVLYKDTILTLSKLRQKGYIIGIISNTKMPRDMFIKGLEKIDLLKYFNGKIILSSDKGMCRKGCNLIFQSVGCNKGYYVGNNFEKDIISAINNDFIGVYIKRETDKIRDFQGNIVIKELNELINII